jgi:dolichyl-phosphate beta-glucosyltransferase
VACVVRIPIHDDEARCRPVEDQVLVIAILRSLDTEQAARRRLTLFYVRHPPRGPELIQSLFRPARVRRLYGDDSPIIAATRRPLELLITTSHLSPVIRLSIVIPAYNEAGRLPGTLDRLHDYLSTQSFAWEIIIAVNGSTDGTEEVVDRIAQRMPGLRALRLAERGKGAACRAGALESSGEVVFLCDADLSMPPETLERFLGAMERSDIVIGSREAPGARRFSEPRHRHVMGRVFNHLVQILVVQGITDTQCGFKAFSKRAGHHLFAQQTVKGWGFDVELLFLARKFGYGVQELPIEWYFDADSRVRPGTDTLNMFAEVCMIRIRSALGRYRPMQCSPAPSRGDVGR